MEPAVQLVYGMTFALGGAMSLTQFIMADHSRDKPQTAKMLVVMGVLTGGLSLACLLQLLLP
jgi:hypothetical protein